MLHLAKGMISQTKMASLLLFLSMKRQTKTCLLTTCGMKGINMGMIKTLWNKMFPPPTSDQELIKQLKDAVREVARLGAEAQEQGISVLLFHSYSPDGSKTFFVPLYLKWESAVRTTSKQIG